MTTCLIDHHAIGRRQYALLMNRELRRTRRDMRLETFRDGIFRVAGYVLWSCSIIAFTLAFGGWLWG